MRAVVADKYDPAAVFLSVDSSVAETGQLYA